MFFNQFIKNPQTTIALTFLTHIISDIGGVLSKYALHNWNSRWTDMKSRNFFVGSK